MFEKGGFQFDVVQFFIKCILERSLGAEYTSIELETLENCSQPSFNI